MLLDGHSLAFRAFFALPAENFKTVSGQTTNAVYGFTSMLINLLRDEQPTHIGAAFDVSRQTFRAEAYAEYKANRSSPPDEFRGQVELTKDVLGALGIPVMAEAGFEADDIIATLTTQAEPLGYRVLVVTGDRDAIQLVNDDVTVLYPRKGVSRPHPFHPGRGDEQVWAHPDAVPRLRGAARGPERQSARHPGCGGEDRRQVDPRVRRSQHPRRPGGRGPRQGRRGAAREPVQRPAQPAADRDGARRQAAVHARTAAARRLGPGEDPSALRRSSSSASCATACSRRWCPPNPRRTRVSRSAAAPVPAGEVGGWLDRHASTGLRHGISIDGRGTPYGGDVHALAIAASGGEGGYVDVTKLTPEDEQALGAWLADAGQPKAVHEAKFAMHALRGRGWTLGGAQQRHRARRLPGAARAAQLQPRRPLAALPASRVARRQARTRATVAARRRGRRRHRTCRDRDPARAGGARPGRRVRRGAVRNRVDAAARRDGTAVAHGARKARGSRHRRGPRPPARVAERFRGAGVCGGGGGLRRDRQADQSRLAEAATGGAVRRARDAEDQAHQDRLHHRRGRAAEPVREDAASRSSSICSRIATRPG